ncbi:unnamed protein product [Penicillium palitans]
MTDITPSNFRELVACTKYARKVYYIREEYNVVLIHCNQGKHRTGCLVACFRELQGWEHSAIIDEYRLYAGQKARQLEFIRLYELGAISQIAYEANVAGWDRGQ